MRTFLSAIAATLLAGASLPACADAVFDFYKLGRGAAGGDFRPIDGIVCSGSDLCSSNVDWGVRGGDLTFVAGGVTARATATYRGAAAAVVQDSESGWTSSHSAGLGVYHTSWNSSDDNITSGETLTVTFDRAVRLTSIGLRSDGHNFTGWASDATFLFGGHSMALPDNIGSIALDLIGQSFSFAFGGSHADQFYLSSMSVQTPLPDASTVPEPAGFALMLAGLGALGWTGRRRGQPANARRSLSA